MAWTAPRTWVTGEVVTAALLNTHVRDDLRYLKGTDGGVSLDDVNGSYLELPNMTTANLPGSPTAGMMAYDTTMAGLKDYAGGFGGFWTPRAQLLVQANGNSTATGATVLSSIAMASSLKAGDLLFVLAQLHAVTQNNTGGFRLRNTTDSVDLENGGSTTMNAATAGVGLYVISQSGAGATTIITHAQTITSTGVGTRNTLATFTTAWTGAWTLALYADGVVSGGTLYYHWQVLRLPAL